ncbi:hypothetical protein EPO17_03015 [Patescibacteria group bacterium]|nr:MAG: hypothetical protein EPO17_03015 [Patescibacteria group bacterium]
MAKKVLWVVVIVLVVWGLYSLSKKPEATGPIKIGFIAPLSGDAAAYGEPLKKGVEIAVSEINAKGGVDGRSLEIIYEDGKCNNKDASTAAQKLISIDKVKVIIGMVCSGELLSVAPIAETAKVIVIGQGSSPDITKAGDYIFRTFPSDTIVGTALAENMSKNGYDTVAIVAENTAYALALEKDFVSKTDAAKLQVVASEHYAPDVKDFRSILQKIKVTNPKALLLDSQTGANGARLAQQARTLGIKSQFYTAYFSGPEFVKTGKAVEGAYVVDAPALGSDNQRATDFLKKSQAVYGAEPTYPFFSANAYDQVYLLASIFEKVGSEDTSKIKQELYATKSFPGITGTFGFDENGDVTNIGMRVMQIKDGTLVEVK